jgi:hypothetical protein
VVKQTYANAQKLYNLQNISKRKVGTISAIKKTVLFKASPQSIDDTEKDTKSVSFKVAGEFMSKYKLVFLGED